MANHAPRFLLYARQLARREADAHDLVQEAVVESLPEAKTGAVIVNRGWQKTQIMFGSIQASKTVNGIDCYRKP